MIEISYLITRTMRTAVMVVSCALHYIPSQSSCNHEFLLVESCSVEGESVMLIIERAPSNGGIRVISSSGGAARDTITVVRAGSFSFWPCGTPSIIDVSNTGSITSTGGGQVKSLHARVYFDGITPHPASWILLLLQVSHLPLSITTIITFGSVTGIPGSP
ncbi:hypothetical protein F5J12DRAFT_865341 [Pisolithus orientalis]|uniref:uncharacterized protein n=1 Tax=Pisolithus orientalis TaxID=936130 RepID=UPI002224B7C4|nr:uncharacterized protein F5J12DRAFT_865341 [Pisolithus orientalis]KAI5988649.1 hypothetical protein F5J12DRAFT_865341 [Pisolithus orientalis]